MSQLIVQICKLSLTLTLLRHNLLHIVLQVNQSKTQPLIILTGIKPIFEPLNHLLLLFEFYINFLKVANPLIAKLIWAGCTITFLFTEQKVVHTYNNS